MKTADPELMRAINRFHVMDAIRRFGPVSRVEISQLTELSSTTVSAITAALLDDRLIIALQVGAVRDAGRGRPRVMLKLNPDAAYVVGVKLAHDQITVGVTNFCADILRSLALPIRIDRQTASVIADLVEDVSRRDESMLTGRTRQGKLVHFAATGPGMGGTPAAGLPNAKC